MRTRALLALAALSGSVWGLDLGVFDSVEKAQAAARRALADPQTPAGALVVTLADGAYFLPKTVSFGADDSGTAARPVRWRAQTRGGVRITGGVPVPGLVPLAADDPAWGRIPAEARGHVRVADLKAAGISDYGRVRDSGLRVAGMALVWGGRFQTLAEWPNDGFTGIAAPVPAGTDANGRPKRAVAFVYADDRVSAWADESEPYGNGFFCHNWAAARVAFAAIVPATKTITQKGRGSGYGYSKNGFWRGINLLCELDAPGEYYIDHTAGRLYFWPPTGNGGGDASALTMTADLFALVRAKNVSFEGFVFENCRGTAVRAVDCEGVNLIGCTVRNVGMKGVDFSRTVKSRIAGCDIFFCGAGGISVRGGDPDALRHADVVVDNCHIHHYSVDEFTYCGAVGFGGCGVTVTRCTIHDGPHTALVFSGREHTISSNEIHSVCIESGEMGAVYNGRDWTLCGNAIVGNWFHDIYNPRSQRNRAIMLDDGSAGATIALNRFERVAEGVSLSAIGNRVEHNLFISNFPPISAWQKWEHAEDYANPRYTHAQLLELLARLPVHEEPWKTKYPYLGMIDDAIRTGRPRDPATRTVIRGNAAVGGTTNLIAFMGAKYAYSPATWDVGGNVVGAGALPDGLKALPPLAAIGVYRSPERASWPVVHPVSRKYTNLTFGR
ncbi:MAG: right-handed parallel beta-helix repeat-containing protein [Kiritimatiellia bacterium]